jgi:hypothetical protein
VSLFDANKILFHIFINLCILGLDLDPDPHSSESLDPEPHIKNANLKH